MDKFLEIYILPKFNQEERDNLNKPISRSEIESIIKKKKKSLQTKVQDQTASLGNSTKHTKLSFSNHTKIMKRREHLQIHSMKPSSP